MKLRMCPKLKEADGQAMVEFALVLPVLLLLALCIFDVSRAIHANNIISNVSREGANLASRTSFMPQDIMNALANTAQPLPMSSNGMMYITVVQGSKDSGSSKIVTKIQSQSAWAQGKKKNGSKIKSSSIATILANITINDGDTISIVEVFYSYSSIFANAFFKFAPELYSMTIL